MALVFLFLTTTKDTMFYIHLVLPIQLLRSGWRVKTCAFMWHLTRIFVFPRCRCIFTWSRFLRYPNLSFKNNPDTVRHLKVTTVHIPVFLIMDFLFNVSMSLPLLIIGIQSCKCHHMSQHVFLYTPCVPSDIARGSRRVHYGLQADQLTAAWPPCDYHFL